ncbi:MAG: amidophosphoribosyltransferase [Planctomycetota bacterium]|nr:MAG: amidophosphoribosyltransferase [Planctomycetota bacterium]
MCGVLGILTGGHAAAEIYEGLTAIQHRGQDAAGIVTWDGAFHLKKGNGLVHDAVSEKNIKRLKGHIGIGHVRYPTVGGGGAEDAQPFFLSYPLGLAMVYNGNLTNYHELKRELETKKFRYINTTCDVEVLLSVFAEDLLKHGPTRTEPDVYFDALRDTYAKIKGAYSTVALIAGRGMLAFRDPYGIKPLIMGERILNGEKDYAIASESVALAILGFSNHRDIGNGEAIFIDLDGKVTSRIIERKKHTPCIFEYVYFARPDSFIDRISVYRTRRRFGKELAKLWREKKLKADAVIPVPDSAQGATLALSDETGIKYREGLVKNRYIGRTFIMPAQKKRRQSIRRKLNTINTEFGKKNVLLIDDSIVRGSTSAQIINLARQAGAKKVYFGSYSAPLRHPCYYGIDMQTRSEFVARDRDVDEIAKKIGADALVYNTVEGMVSAAHKGNRKITEFCTACFTGCYPAGDIPEETREAIARDRIRADRDRDSVNTEE